MLFVALDIARLPSDVYRLGIYESSAGKVEIKLLIKMLETWLNISLSSRDFLP